ncbi:hypothetical protein Tco_1197056 [Tanacetum coccineum]
MSPLPPREQRHRFFRYEGLEYTDSDIADFESRLWRIYTHEVADFLGMPDLLRDGLTTRMFMEHRDEAGVSVFTSGAWRRMFDIWGPLFQLGGARRRMSWREFIIALGLHTEEEMQTVGFRISSAGDFLSIAPSYTLIRDPILRLCHRLIPCSIAGRSQTPEKVTVTNLFYLRGLDVDSVNVPYLLARYLRLFAAGRKSGVHISGGQFVARLADHFGLLTAEILGGLTVIAPELPVIDMIELVKMQICVELVDTWAWVAMGPERQPDDAAGAPAEAEDALIINEGTASRCWELTRTCGEIDDRSGEILYMDDDVYDAADGG